ncbi:MAG: hypothetical protein ACYCZF_13065 [Anaerolineae bacterium]
MEQGILHRLANLCKDYYVIREINDLFTYAGANDEWWIQQPIGKYSSQRVERFFGWIEGIQTNSPKQMTGIFDKVMKNIIANTKIPEAVRDTVREAYQQLQEPEQEDKGIQLDPLLATLAKVLSAEGLARELAVVTSAEVRFEWESHDNFGDVDIYGLLFSVPLPVFSQIESDLHRIQDELLKRIHKLVRAYPDESISRVTIAPKLLADYDWRNKATAWLTGQGVSNQGRVRSDNIADRECDGLQFRSQPEINLYKALKAAGVSFAPLPVFVRGGNEYRRIEPDFVIIKDGIMMIVEVDGDTFHQELPAEAYYRTTMLENEGARISRVKANECDTPEKATACAVKVLQTISRLKVSSR